MYTKINGTLNTTLNNHWASGTNNKAIDSFYVIATGTGEGHNIDLDFLKTELKVDAGQADNAILASTFQSQARTATSAPTTVRLVLLGKEEATQTLNTDTVFSISRNNGSNFSAVTMVISFIQ